MDITPYYLINNEQISVNASTMTANFTIQQIASNASINKAMLILSKTQFVDDVNNVFRQDYTNIEAGAIQLTADIAGNSDISNAHALFGRVGVYANGADQAIYSSVVRLR